MMEDMAENRRIKQVKAFGSWPSEENNVASYLKGGWELYGVYENNNQNFGGVIYVLVKREEDLPPMDLSQTVDEKIPIDPDHWGFTGPQEGLS